MYRNCWSLHFVGILDVSTFVTGTPHSPITFPLASLALPLERVTRVGDFSNTYGLQQASENPFLDSKTLLYNLSTVLSML